MKKLAAVLAFVAVMGMVGQSFAQTDTCPKKGYHVDKAGKCVKNEVKKVTTS